jgi:hypothetical protein
MPLIFLPAFVSAQIGSAEPKLKFRTDQPPEVVIEELVHPAPSSSEFRPFTLEMPILRRLWKL